MTISVNYINDGYDSLFNDDVNLYESFLDECMEKVYEASAKFKIDTEEDSMFESFSFMNTEKVVYEEAKKSFIERIGAQIIAIGKKFVELMKKIGDKIKDVMFGIKSNEKKMNELVKRHPEIAKEKIQVLCSEGGLEFSDMKSLAQLDKAFDEIVKMAEKGDVDPNTLKGKWEKAKKKWFDSDTGKIVKAGKIIGVATATVGLALAVKKFSGDSKKAKNIANEETLKGDRKTAELYDKIKSSKIKEGYVSTLLAMWRENRGYHAKAMGISSSFLSRQADRIAHALDKLVGSKAAKSVIGDKELELHSQIRHAKNEKRREEKKDLLKEEKKSYAQTMGKTKADSDFYKANKDNIDSREQERSKYQTKGKNEANLEDSAQLNKQEADKVKARKKAEDKYYRKHRDDILKQEEDKAEAQARGKAKLKSNNNDDK